MYSIMIKNKNNNESIKVTVRYACDKKQGFKGKYPVML